MSDDLADDLALFRDEVRAFLGEALTPDLRALTARQAGGFALWASRSVLSGSGDQVVDLARTNLRQLELE